MAEYDQDEKVCNELLQRMISNIIMDTPLPEELRYEYEYSQIQRSNENKLLIIGNKTKIDRLLWVFHRDYNYNPVYVVSSIIDDVNKDIKLDNKKINKQLIIEFIENNKLSFQELANYTGKEFKEKK
eukprot:360951_1